MTPPVIRLPKHTKQFCWRTVPQRLSQLLMVWNYQGHFFIMIAESLRYQGFCFGTPVDLGQWLEKKLEKQKYLMKNTSGSGSTWTLNLGFGVWIFFLRFFNLNLLVRGVQPPDSTMTWMSLRGVGPSWGADFFMKRCETPKLRSFAKLFAASQRLSFSELFQALSFGPGGNQQCMPNDLKTIWWCPWKSIGNWALPWCGWSLFSGTTYSLFKSI